MAIFVYNLPRRLKKSFFNKVVKQSLKKEGKGKNSLAIVFLKEREIQSLNSRYRKQNRPTDVLSFASQEKGYLGEILLCQDQIKKNAKKFGETFEKELVRILIHGLLHLLGYDHEKNAGAAKKMFQKQERYLADFRV